MTRPIYKKLYQVFLFLLMNYVTNINKNRKKLTETTIIINLSKKILGNRNNNN